MKKRLAPFKMQFNKNRSRSGVCKFMEQTIYISAFVVDHGVSASGTQWTQWIRRMRWLLRHELTHAALDPKVKHGAEWKALNTKMGGDGKVCDDDAETRAAIGFKVYIVCSNGVHAGRPGSPIANDANYVKDADGHMVLGRNKRPATHFMKRLFCPACKEEGRKFSLNIWRVA
jgi:hypothetical protein